MKLVFAAMHEVALGTKCECRPVRVMAAPKGTADPLCTRHVAARDNSDIRRILLFDHLIDGCKQRRPHVEPERVGGLEVEHELELGGLLAGRPGCDLLRYRKGPPLVSRRARLPSDQLLGEDRGVGRRAHLHV
jgi:hypothetical protein